MVSEKTEFETERLEIERKRLALEETRTWIESKFFNRHFGAIITAVVSVAAALVSGTQIYLQNKQHSIELERESSARLKDQQLAEQRLLLDGVEVVIQRSEDLLAAPPDRKELLRNTVLVGLPSPLGQAVAKALDGAKPNNTNHQDSARVVGPPVELKSTGTSDAAVELPPGRIPRLVIIQASARSAAGPGGTMDLLITIDGKECNRSSVYRNPAADPVLIATASCFKELGPSTKPTKIAARAPNRIAEAFSVELTAKVFDARASGST